MFKEDERTSLSLANVHLTAVIYWRFKKGVAVANGYPIYPKGSVDFEAPGDDVKGEMWVISDTAGAGLRIYEGFGEE